DHPPELRLALLPRHDLEALGVGDRHHVRLLDGVEAGDRGAVEAHPVVEGALDLVGRDREALQMTLDVGEPEENELDALVLDPGEDALARLLVGRCPVLRLNLRHVTTSLEDTKSPGSRPRDRGSVASNSPASLHWSAVVRGRETWTSDSGDSG